MFRKMFHLDREGDCQSLTNHKKKFHTMKLPKIFSTSLKKYEKNNIDDGAKDCDLLKTAKSRHSFNINREILESVLCRMSFDKKEISKKKNEERTKKLVTFDDEAYSDVWDSKALLSLKEKEDYAEVFEPRKLNEQQNICLESSVDKIPVAVYSDFNTEAYTSVASTHNRHSNNNKSNRTNMKPRMATKPSWLTLKNCQSPEDKEKILPNKADTEIEPIYTEIE